MELNKWICAKKKANRLYIYKGHNKSQNKLTQWNLSPIRVRNQMKFTPNPSPIRIRIPTCAAISILGITFGLNVQSRWFKLDYKFNLKGYNSVVCQKSEF